MEEMPPNASWFLRKAVAAFYAKRYRLARLLFLVKLLFQPRDYYTLCWYANAQYFSGPTNDHDAERNWRKAIRIDHDNALAHAGLGKMYHSNAMRISEGYRMFPGGSGVMFSDELDSNGPRESGEVRIPGFADAHCANRKVGVRELEFAAELTDDVEDKVALLTMAAQLHCLIDNRSAVSAYKKVLALDSHNEQARFDLAACYAALGRKRQAVEQYKALAELNAELAPQLRDVLSRYGVAAPR